MDDIVKSSESPEGSEEVPLFSFGILADVQYGDIDDKQNYDMTAWRYYRQSAIQVKKAIQKWNLSRLPVAFLLQLGDLIDGFNTLSNSSQEALEKMEGILSEFKGSGGIHHTWGNHEYYNFSRKFLMASSLYSNPASESKRAYYSFSPYVGCRVIVMDMYEVGLLGYDETDPEYQHALRIIKSVNPNGDLNSPKGLSGMDTRYSKINGAVSETQLSWLDETLTKADQEGEWVVVVGKFT